MCLSHSSNLTIPREISNLRVLKGLYLNDCESITHTHYITELTSLKILDIRNSSLPSPRVQTWAKGQLEVFLKDAEGFQMIGSGKK